MTIIDEGLPLAELQSRHVAQPVIDAITAAMRSRSHRTPSVAQFIAQLTPSPHPVSPSIPTTDDVTVVQAAPVIEQKPLLQDRTFNVGGVTFKMIAVEGGTFMMGATAEQGNMAEDDEKHPRHFIL